MYTESALRTLCTLAARSTEYLSLPLSLCLSLFSVSLSLSSIPQAHHRLLNESGAVK